MRIHVSGLLFYSNTSGKVNEADLILDIEFPRLCYNIHMANDSEKTFHYVYILECSDGSLYTGWTTDLNARIATHNSGKGAKYTRSRLPVRLVYHETFTDKIAAQQREREIKKLSRARKLELISRNSKPVPVN